MGEEKTKDNGVTWITKAKAMGEFGIKPKILATIECREVDNPHYRAGPPMRLYRLDQIQELAKDTTNLKKTFVNRELGSRMSQIQKQVHENKRQKALDYVRNNLGIHEEEMPHGKELYDEAYRGYDVFFSCERGKEASPPGWNGIIAYVRHVYTNYESLMNDAARHCDVRYREIHDEAQLLANTLVENVLLEDEELRNLLQK
jgi:hypothetical protein